MATIIGRVRCIELLENWGGTVIQVTPTARENVILWSEVPTVNRAVLFSNWVSLLRQAMTSNLDVQIETRGNAGLAFEVQLGRI